MCNTITQLELVTRRKREIMPIIEMNKGGNDHENSSLIGLYQIVMVIVGHLMTMKNLIDMGTKTKKRTKSIIFMMFQVVIETEKLFIAKNLFKMIS